MISTAIARVTGIIMLAYTNRITAISHRHQHDSTRAKVEHATEFSLVDDSGDHVLNFGAPVHGRRLDSTKTLRLNFKAFGATHSYHLHRSPSVLSETTKFYRYNQANGGYDIHDAAGHEARLFSSEGVALTFLAHDKIKGRVLLHNRHEDNNVKFENKFLFSGARIMCERVR